MVAVDPGAIQFLAVARAVHESAHEYTNVGLSIRVLVGNSWTATEQMTRFLLTGEPSMYNGSTAKLAMCLRSEPFGKLRTSVGRVGLKHSARPYRDHASGL